MTDRQATVAGYFTIFGLPILAQSKSLTLPLMVCAASVIVWWMMFSRDGRK